MFAVSRRGRAANPRCVPFTEPLYNPGLSGCSRAQMYAKPTNWSSSTSNRLGASRGWSSPRQC
eukprot:7380997-Prymnesium_polylepis.1